MRKGSKTLRPSSVLHNLSLRLQNIKREKSPKSKSLPSAKHFRRLLIVARLAPEASIPEPLRKEQLQSQVLAHHHHDSELQRDQAIRLRWCVLRPDSSL